VPQFRNIETRNKWEILLLQCIKLAPLCDWDIYSFTSRICFVFRHSLLRIYCNYDTLSRAYCPRPNRPLLPFIFLLFPCRFPRDCRARFARSQWRCNTVCIRYSRFIPEPCLPRTQPRILRFCGGFIL